MKFILKKQLYKGEIEEAVKIKIQDVGRGQSDI